MLFNFWNRLRVSRGGRFQPHQRLAEWREVVQRGDQEQGREAGERERLLRSLEPSARRQVRLVAMATRD